jgi:hypothetical protein
MGSTGVEATQAQPTTLRDGDDSDAIALFDRAVVEAMRGRECKAEEVAALLGVSYQHLSDFRTGKRKIALHRAVRLGNVDPDNAGRAVLAMLSEAWGYEPPRRRRRLGKADVKHQLELELKKQPQIFELFVERIARSSGASEDEVRDAWSETTDIRSFRVDE